MGNTCSKRNLKYQKNNPAREITCPEGALRVQPGLNSFSKAVKEAKEKDINCLFLESGVHDEKGYTVTIDFALKVVGQNRDDVKIIAGVSIKGQEVFFSDCTVTGANGDGFYVNEKKDEYDNRSKCAAMHLKNVCVENCGGSGVYVVGCKRNTMTDCNVNNNTTHGVSVMYAGLGCSGGRMVIYGSATTIHHNNPTRGGSEAFGYYFGLRVHDSNSSIHLVSPLTTKSISTNNGGGRNHNGFRPGRTISETREVKISCFSNCFMNSNCEQKCIFVAGLLDRCFGLVCGGFYCAIFWCVLLIAICAVVVVFSFA